MVGRSIVAGLELAVAEIAVAELLRLGTNNRLQVIALAVLSTTICSPLGGSSRGCNLLTDIGCVQLCHWHERKQSREG